MIITKKKRKKKRNKEGEQEEEEKLVSLNGVRDFIAISVNSVYSLLNFI